MKMKIFTLVSFFSALLSAQDVLPYGLPKENNSSADYYESAYKLSGTALRLALHNIIKNHTEVSYASLWTHFQTTDKKSNGKVWDMYSDVPGGTPPYEFTFVSNQCGNYNSEADCYNREHSWPKSWFNDLAPMYSDLYHLFPTDGYVNNRRDNYNYGNVSSPTWTSQNGSKLGPNTFAGYTGTVFEPITAYKGDLARGHFYMSVRYYTEDGGWSTSDGTNKADLLPWYANLLYSWHLLDTVSAKERQRNEAVFGIQKNRNPFIDHPEFAAEIWQTAEAPVVVSVVNTTSTTTMLDFSRYLDSSVSVTALNFEIDQSVGNPISIEWGVNNDVSKLLLTTSTLASGTTCALQIKNLKSINGIALRDTTVVFKSIVTTAVTKERILSTNFQLEQNYPNPFNPETAISYQLPVISHITLKVYDVLGKEVITLADQEKQPGSYSISFDGSSIPSGVYFYTLQAGSFRETKRMLLLK